MSEIISSLEKGVEIGSIAFSGNYHIFAMKRDEGEVASDEIPYEKYPNVLKKIWENYLNKGEIPHLLEFPLSDNGLATETLHCIAPGGFAPSDGPLPKYRENFMYWIKSQESSIKQTIDSKEFDFFMRDLDNCIKINLERKAEI